MNGKGAADHLESGPKKDRDNLALEIIAGPCGNFLIQNGRSKWEKQKVYPSTRASITIGRTKKNILVVEDESVSSKHALLEWADNCWTIQDLGSSNGSRVNGTPVQPAVKDADHRVRLQDGDIIRLGSETVLQVTTGPAMSDDMTVERYLELECSMLIKRLQARSEFLQGELRNQADQLKARLREAVPSVK